MISRIARGHVFAAALPLLLGACAGMHPATTEQSAPTAAARKFSDTAELAGRLSLRYQHNGKDEALHGSFTWSQAPAQTTVTLLSPLGQTIALIEVSPNGAALKQSGQPVRSAADVDALTVETLGWPLPVSGLRTWLQGFALDSTGGHFVATPATPEVTTQDGWHIRYANWQGDGTSTAPNTARRIDLTRRTAQVGDVSIRLVIDTWQTR